MAFYDRPSLVSYQTWQLKSHYDAFGKEKPLQVKLLLLLLCSLSV